MEAVRGGGRRVAVAYPSAAAAAASSSAGPEACGCKGSRSCLLCEEAAPPPQDYGPKVNFKKRKLKLADFSGLPKFSQELVTRMKNHSPLAGFSPVEQCNLDYGPERGSAIDPHLDDWWLWGERLVSLNLLSSTVLSMTCDSEDSLQLFPASLSEKEQRRASGSPSVFQNHHQSTSFTSERLGNTIEWEADYSSSTKLVPSKDITVAVHLPRRSLVVLYGPARYVWKHAIYRNHITSRRICVTFRELSQEFSNGGEQEALGRKLLQIALTFQGTPM
ncbi:PREDICTED: alpha-ketoglutarate-dependent dioxygenase alkB homolog 4 isoform X2 [Gekko japonicus]|uniref:Alpha-ketoglutarate-dependent dioxygenase alkB homolog 4 isoform X2 n=1 Tax=Gekko japonicus TaxID=146911 RepID=A0ABM1JPZ9_GEKJA|nr:PREDICTED: alpha-ketoglutarate-dependent dioxygenase alkB homolog 4 isoform X2 [Gekko japonicus]